MSRMHKHLSILAFAILTGACSKEGPAPTKPPSAEADAPALQPAAATPPSTPSVSTRPEVEDRGTGVGIIGLGVVGSEIVGEVSCADDDLGGREFPLYDSPGGAQVATLRLEEGEHGGCYPVLRSEGATQSVGIGGDPDFREISYEAAALVYFETRDGYARTFEHRLPPGVWVRINEVPGGKLQLWTDLMTESPKYYYRHEGSILRSEPSEDSSAIVTIRFEAGSETLVHEALPTGEVSGQWGKFEVVEYDGDFRAMSRGRQPSKTGNTWEGWLRLVDDSGKPTFWFYTRD